MTIQSFHLALPCNNIDKTKKFYQNTLGAKLGRSSDSWADINLYGNQITFTAAGSFDFEYKSYRLGEHILPSFHFGIVIDSEPWQKLHDYLVKSDLDVTDGLNFFKGKKGEHRSFFVKDPNGYMVEFKSFKNPEAVFAT